MKRRLLLCGLFWALCTCVSPAVDLRIMIPLYIYPSWYSPASYVWDDVAAAASRVPVTAIINPHNGPDGGPPNTDYVHGLADLRNGGVTILGYVYTGYGTRNIEEVKADIDLYDAYYDIDGIFLDEADNTTNHLAYYTNLYTYIKSRTNLNDVVINPGMRTVEGYISAPAADTAVIFESGTGWTNHVPDSYVADYPPERFCALLYNVTNEAAMRQDVDLAVQRNIGFIYVTDDAGDNPWDTIPPYWTNLVDYVENYRNLGITLSGTDELRLNIIPERTWQVQYTSNLLDGAWTPLAGGVASAARISITDSSAATNSVRFYRLQIFQ